MLNRNPRERVLKEQNILLCKIEKHHVFHIIIFFFHKTKSKERTRARVV